MKVLFVLIAALACATPLIAGVEVNDGLVTAQVQSEPLRNVLKTIGEQTGVQISLDSSAAGEMVYANFEKLPIGAAIRKLLEGTDINYALVDGVEGNPPSLFVSKSESPGAPPKKLDTRPVNASPNRGIVTPVQPMPPQPVISQPGNTVRDEKGNNSSNQPRQQPFGSSGNTVPTGGSLNPTFNPNPQNPNQPNQKQDMQNIVEDEEDDEDDEDEDE